MIYGKVFWTIIIGWLSLSALWAQDGLMGTYYRGAHFDHPVLTRQDSAINFNWSAGSPAAGIPADRYSVRWTGTLRAPVSGSYHFSAQASEGIRVWVDNQLVVESWPSGRAKHFEGSLTLQAGRRYDVWVDYYNGRASGKVKLLWERPDAKSSFWERYTSSGEVIPARYFGKKVHPKAVLPSVNTEKPLAHVRQPQRSSSRRISRSRAHIAVAKPPVLPLPSSLPTSFPSIAPWLAELKVGKPFSLPQVQFEQSSYRLVAESSAVLDELLMALKQHEHWQLEIVGHTDNVGDARLNQTLSEQRARVVAHYLIRRGIADVRIRTRGEGGRRPIADNGLVGERARNRRVEFTIQ